VQSSAISARAARRTGDACCLGVSEPKWAPLGIFSLATVMSVLAVSSETSDAHARRKHVTSTETSSSEEPRYSDIVVDGNSGAVLHASNPDALRHPPRSPRS